MSSEFNQEKSIKQSPIEEMFDTPLINNSIYSNLPKVLKDGVDLFAVESRERDMFFTSAVTLISGSLPNCYFYYDNRKHYLNLYAMIVAPPASGKGVMVHANKYVSKIEDHLTEIYNEQLIKFNQAEKDAKNVSKEEKNEGNISEPVPEKANVHRPKRKKLVIPANSSAASFLGLLNDSNGSGILFETEADTLAQALKQDWGNYSDTLRKAYHHEPVTFSRKMDNMVVDIKCPKLSVENPVKMTP